jgi:hypothetical protein
VKYTPMRIPCDLCAASFEEALGTVGVPIYLHVHPSRLGRAQEILAARDTTCSPKSPIVIGEPRRIEAVADKSITNVEEWFLVTSIGSSPA